MSDEASGRPAVTVADFADAGSADAIAALLRSEGVSAEVEAWGLFAGLQSHYEVIVPAEPAHRARWILQESEFRDGELTYLATGGLGSDSDERALCLSADALVLVSGSVRPEEERWRASSP